MNKWREWSGVQPWRPLRKIAVMLFAFTLATAWSFTLAVPVAQAKGSPSFKGGFSSYRPAPKPSYRSSPKAEKPKNNFGSFQKQAPTNADQTLKGSSADLNQAAAKQNAWNSYQASQQKKLNSAGGSGGNNGGWNSGGAGGNGKGWDDGGRFQRSNSPQSTVPQQVIHRTYENRSGGGFMHGLMWFMIGQSWGNHHNTVVYQQPQSATPAPSDSTQTNATASTNAEWEQPLVNTAVEEKESAFWKVLRLMLWIGFMWLIIVVIKQVIGVKRFVQDKRYRLRSF